MRKVQWRNNCSNQHLDAKEPHVLKIFSYICWWWCTCAQHTIVSLLCVVLRESGQLSSVQRDFFAGDPFDSPDRPSAQSLVRRGRKIELICKAKLCGKTLTTRNQLIQASSAAFIVGLFSTNRKWDGTNIFFTCQLTISMLG